MDGPHVVEVLEALKNLYGTRPWNWHTQQKPFYVLIATILSQRTRDSQTDEAAQRLFSRYSSPQALASAPIEEIEKLIIPVNFYRTKAKRIKEVSSLIVRDFGGEVPRSFDLLTRLPGVGRKTANCVLLYGFHETALPVDTHVHRIANRLGWIETNTAEDTERLLKSIVPKEWIPLVNDLFVKHGQTLCSPVRPKCSDCPIAYLCKYGKQAFKGK
ncbi:MAG: endonuclease III [Syntrophobacterales bacterium]|nr:endonuclease III [Syntrophobacterales bacterium]